MAPQVTQQTLDLARAISILVQGVQIGQAKGVYTLADASLLHQSVLLVNQALQNTVGAQQQSTTSSASAAGPTTSSTAATTSARSTAAPAKPRVPPPASKSRQDDNDDDEDLDRDDKVSQ